MKRVVGLAFCGSFCTFRKTIDTLKQLTESFEVVPILSAASYETDTRFGAAADNDRMLL